MAQCHGDRYGRGLCAKHYQRAKRNDTIDRYSAIDETSEEPTPGNEPRRLTEEQVSEIEAALREVRLIISGPNYELEEQASALLVQDRKDSGLKGIRLTSEEYCWLSDIQLESRQLREVYTAIGAPDAGIREGMFARAYNPLIGTRPRRPTAD